MPSVAYKNHITRPEKHVFTAIYANPLSIVNNIKTILLNFMGLCYWQTVPYVFKIAVL